MRRRFHSSPLLLAAWLCAPRACAAPVFEDLALARDLICAFRKSGGESRKCMRFGAVIAWHFDRSVHKHPDRTFLALPGNSYAGHCEPWNLE